MLQIETRVFHRIIEEHIQRTRSAAVSAISETMQETVRFGGFADDVIMTCAEERLDAHLARS